MYAPVNDKAPVIARAVFFDALPAKDKAPKSARLVDFDGAPTNESAAVMSLLVCETRAPENERTAVNDAVKTCAELVANAPVNERTAANSDLIVRFVELPTKDSAPDTALAVFLEVEPTNERDPASA